MRSGSTKLIVGASKAKFCGESFGEVRFVIAPQKSGHNADKYAFETKQNCAQQLLVSKSESSGIV